VGRFALEAMATGNVVLAGNMPAYELIPGSLPAVFATPGNLYSKLRGVIMNRDERHALALEGREYVEKYHDHVKVAKQVLKIIEDVGAGRIEYDYYPDFIDVFYPMIKEIEGKERKLLIDYYKRTLGIG
jgi:hypothetical protein